MFQKTFIFICGIAAGVLVYDQMHERATVRMPSGTMPVPYTVPCDATVNGKCYTRGMK